LSHHSATYSLRFLVLTVHHLIEHTLMCDESEVSVRYDGECVSQNAVNETLEKKAKG
jgi:hypothetical protein